MNTTKDEMLLKTRDQRSLLENIEYSKLEATKDLRSDTILDTTIYFRPETSRYYRDYTLLA